MSYKQYKHLMAVNFMGIRDKVKKFQKKRNNANTKHR